MELRLVWEPDNLEPHWESGLESSLLVKWERLLNKEGFILLRLLQRIFPLLMNLLTSFYSVNTVVFHLRQACFEDFVFRQTIFSNLEDMKKIEGIKEGYGKGSFVIIKAKKQAMEAL